MPFKITLAISFFIFSIVSCKKHDPVPDKATPGITGFNISTKHVGDATFLIPQVASNSTGAFTYSSSNAAVASIKGDSIQINSAGTVTITAMQAGTASFTAGSVTTSFKVLPSVYITGWSSGSIDQPMYWRNGIATNLSGQGTTNSIFINNNDVYIGGAIQIGNDGFGGYWKNGVPHPIQKNAIVNSIAVLGNDVYAVGYIQTYDQSDNIIATLWKNDVAIPLTNRLLCCGLPSSSEAWAIAINNNVVYVTGTSFDLSDSGAATIWKVDGSAVTLTTPDYTTGTVTVSTGYGITFKGNDMYISGSVGTAYGTDYLGYWKNGTFFPSQLPSAPYPNNTSIVINGSDVYTAGIHAENSLLSAAYWKNGVETILAPNATATGIAFSGSDMYVVGTTLTTSNFTWYPSPVYWLNGTLVKLPSAVPNNTMATSIFIRNQ